MTQRPRVSREGAPLGASTRAVHAGAEHNRTNAVSSPIWQSSTYRLESAARGAEFAQASAPAEFYTRWGSPNVKQLEAAVASLEGTPAALAVSSGMAAVSLAMLTELKAGDHIVAGRSVYSGSVELVNSVLPEFGIDGDLVDATNLDAVRAALTESTRLILIESPTNPRLELCDLRRVAELGRERGVTTAIDNTFATPILQRPYELGFDIVIHSATKGISGHSDATGGVICSDDERIQRAWYLMKLFGNCLSPFEAWLIRRGLKTLPLRIERQSTTALALARALESSPKVKRVHFPGLESHPQHAIACEQMAGFGGMLAVEVDADEERTARFVESLEVATLAVSLGGPETLVEHPASMTHATMSAEERAAAGVDAGLLRISVGLEDPDDLIRDFELAIAREL